MIFVSNIDVKKIIWNTNKQRHSRRYLKISLLPEEKVNGANSGIQRTFRVTEDKFSTGTNNTLVNHKTYYFMVIAYAYNEYAPFSIDEQVTDGLKGQKTPYLAGRRNIKVVSAVPHSPKATGVDVNKLCAYGTQPQITRLDIFCSTT